MTHTNTSYQVNIIGTTWEGFTGSYTYTFDHLPTDYEIRRKAGDFRDVIDYETIATTRTGNWDAETIERKIVDHWQSPESEDMYMEMQG